jgi:hypothetical protein
MDVPKVSNRIPRGKSMTKWTKTRRDPSYQGNRLRKKGRPQAAPVEGLLQLEAKH